MLSEPCIVQLGAGVTQISLCLWCHKYTDRQDNPCFMLHCKQCNVLANNASIFTFDRIFKSLSPWETGKFHCVQKEETAQDS